MNRSRASHVYCAKNIHSHYIDRTAERSTTATVAATPVGNRENCEKRDATFDRAAPYATQTNRTARGNFFCSEELVDRR